MDENGVSVVYMDDGRSAETLDEFIRALRKGDVAVVLWLCLLADPIGNIGVRRNDLKTTMAEIEKKGATIWELGSDLRSSDPEQRDKMIAAAWAGLALARMPVAERQGRPKKWTDPAERKIIWDEWNNPKHKSNGAAAEAATKKLKKKVTPHTMWRICYEMRKETGDIGRYSGGSGRKAGWRDPGWNKHKSQVYFVRYADSDRVKIGVSEGINNRLSSLGGGTPEKITLMATVSGDRRAEARLHKKFARYRIKGEWFRLEGKLAEYIKALPRPKKPMT